MTTMIPFWVTIGSLVEYKVQFKDLCCLLYIIDTLGILGECSYQLNADDNVIYCKNESLG